MRSVLTLLLVWLVFVATLGCGGKPDPRDHPDFREETLKDPSKIPSPGRGGRIDNLPKRKAPGE